MIGEAIAFFLSELELTIEHTGQFERDPVRLLPSELSTAFRRIFFPSPAHPLC